MDPDSLQSAVEVLGAGVFASFCLATFWSLTHVCLRIIRGTLGIGRDADF